VSNNKHKKGDVKMKKTNKINMLLASAIIMLMSLYGCATTGKAFDFGTTDSIYDAFTNLDPQELQIILNQNEETPVVVADISNFAGDFNMPHWMEDADDTYSNPTLGNRVYFSSYTNDVSRCPSGASAPCYTNEVVNDDTNILAMQDWPVYAGTITEATIVRMVKTPPDTINVVVASDDDNELLYAISQLREATLDARLDMDGANPVTCAIIKSAGDLIQPCITSTTPCTDEDGDLFSTEPMGACDGSTCGTSGTETCQGGNDCDDDITGDPTSITCPTTAANCDDTTTTCAICINPDADEACNGVDNNCDTSDTIDEGCDDDTDDYCDGDMIYDDALGTPAVCPNGGDDCDDTEDTVFWATGRTESGLFLCNDGLDNDCDDGEGVYNDDQTEGADENDRDCCPDDDGDSHYDYDVDHCTSGDDCDDNTLDDPTTVDCGTITDPTTQCPTDPANLLTTCAICIWPDLSFTREVCGDGVDNDCDNTAGNAFDDNEDTGRDAGGTGYTSDTECVTECTDEDEDGYSEESDPGAPGNCGSCNGLACIGGDDCMDDATNPLCTDASVCATGDCGDMAHSCCSRCINPDADEFCEDGIDNDCDDPTQIDEPGCVYGTDANTIWGNLYIVGSRPKENKESVTVIGSENSKDKRIAININGKTQIENTLIAPSGATALAEYTNPSSTFCTALGTDDIVWAVGGPCANSLSEYVYGYKDCDADPCGFNLNTGQSRVEDVSLCGTTKRVITVAGREYYESRLVGNVIADKELFETGLKQCTQTDPCAWQALEYSLAGIGFIWGSPSEVTISEFPITSLDSCKPCTDIGGTVCSTGQTCDGGTFEDSSDAGSGANALCCVGGTCEGGTTLLACETATPAGLGGTGCTSGEVCSEGLFTDSSDYGTSPSALCCVGIETLNERCIAQSSTVTWVRQNQITGPFTVGDTVTYTILGQIHDVNQLPSSFVFYEYIPAGWEVTFAKGPMEYDAMGLAVDGIQRVLDAETYPAKRLEWSFAESLMMPLYSFITANPGTFQIILTAREAGTYNFHGEWITVAEPGDTVLRGDLTTGPGQGVVVT